MTDAQRMQRTSADLSGGFAVPRPGAQGFAASPADAAPPSRLGRGLAWALGLGALFWAAVAALVVVLS